MRVGDQFVQPQLRRAAVKQTQAHLFSKTAGEGVNTEIDHPIAVFPSDPTVLGLASLSDVQVCKDLETGCDRWNQATGERFDVLLQDAVLALAELKAPLLRLHMNVAGSDTHGLNQDPVN